MSGADVPFTGQGDPETVSSRVKIGQSGWGVWSIAAAFRCLPGAARFAFSLPQRNRSIVRAPRDNRSRAPQESGNPSCPAPSTRVTIRSPCSSASATDQQPRTTDMHNFPLLPLPSTSQQYRNSITPLCVNPWPLGLLPPSRRRVCLRLAPVWRQTGAVSRPCFMSHSTIANHSPHQPSLRTSTARQSRAFIICEASQ